MSAQTSNQMAQDLKSIFMSCLDILRSDRSHLVGDEALYELSHFLILKLVEPQILKGTIDIDNLNHYQDSSLSDEQKRDTIELIKFSNFAAYSRIEENKYELLDTYNNYIWDGILCFHPKFKTIFEKGMKSSIKTDETIKRMLLKLNPIQFDNYDVDILGEAYESIFVDAVFGAGGKHKSELGQFFTPTKIKQMIVKMVNPVIKENGEIESVMDPSCGTGGILNTVIKHYYQMCKDGLISEERLKQQLIEKIYGIEIKGKIYNLCTSNMLVHTG